LIFCLIITKNKKGASEKYRLKDRLFIAEGHASRPRPRLRRDHGISMHALFVIQKGNPYIQTRLFYFKSGPFFVWLAGEFFERADGLCGHRQLRLS